MNERHPDSAAWPLVVRPVTATDRPAVDAFLASQHADVVARLGELVDARTFEALLAEHGGALAGVATLVVRGEDLEVLTLHAVAQWQGAGAALLAAATEVARGRGCRRLWLTTTNDNLDALRFYQRLGLRLVRVHAGAVERSRTSLKPSIPEVGGYGIAIRDELELELELDGAGRPGAPEPD